MITIAEGYPGAGKTTWLGKLCINFLLPRNDKIKNKTGKIRQVAINMPLGDHIFDAYPDLIRYWSEMEELVNLRDCDIVIDEIANYFDAQAWSMMPSEVKIFMRQHRKRGINIYASTQDFATVDINIRRLTERCFRLYKVIGSRDISATRPVVKHPWGMVLGFDYDPASFKAEVMTYISNVPTEYFFINKRLCNAFNTQYEIPVGKYPPLKHIERFCSNINCKIHNDPLVSHK